MIKIGQKVMFDALKDVKIFSFKGRRRTDVGTVVEVHKDHRWFSVEYFIDDKPIRTSFKFDQIGRDVFKIN